jgi:hypothetical protein
LIIIRRDAKEKHGREIEERNVLSEIHGRRDEEPRRWKSRIAGALIKESWRVVA